MHAELVSYVNCIGTIISTKSNTDVTDAVTLTGSLEYAKKEHIEAIRLFKYGSFHFKIQFLSTLGYFARYLAIILL